MAKNENTESTAMTELERMLAQATQGTPEFAAQADRRASEDAERAAAQSVLLKQTLGADRKH